MSKNSLLKKIEGFVKEQNLIEPNSTILIGFSGGPDSTLLLYFLAKIRKEYNLEIIVAHLDHEWRAESKKEAEFCEVVAKKIGVEFVLARVSEITLEKEAKGSLEEKGRMLRRKFFGTVMQEKNAHLIALAHHADDQQETFFIRLVRGAGVSGLSGMRPREGTYIRPLLNLRKKEILKFLNQEQIPFLEDPTNESMEFLRNRIRAIAIPALKKCDERFEQSLSRTMDRLREADEFIKNYVQKKYVSISVLKDSKKWISIENIFSEHKYVQKQLIMFWLIDSGVTFTPSYSLFEEIIRFLRNKKSIEHLLYHSFRIQKKQGLVTITSNPKK